MVLAQVQGKLNRGPARTPQSRLIISIACCCSLMKSASDHPNTMLTADALVVTKPIVNSKELWHVGASVATLRRLPRERL